MSKDSNSTFSETIKSENQRIENIDKFLEKLDKSDELNSMIAIELMMHRNNIKEQIRLLERRKRGISAFGI